MTDDRESHLVELVDEAGTAMGKASVEAAHRPPGQLHRAFSVLLVDVQGRVLLQLRAAAKTRFPLRWANACCGHPAPGQPLHDAANLRLGEELSIAPVRLTELGVHRYRAADSATGRVEVEYDHVLRGEFHPGTEVRPDPTEVAELRWIGLDELRGELAAFPDRYAPWLPGVIGLLGPAASVPVEGPGGG